MKVGILTIQKSSNYGACLQCYALYKYIEHLGYKCEIIDLHRPGVKHQSYHSSKRFRPFRYSFKKVLVDIIKRLFGSNIEDKYPRSTIRMDKIMRFNNQMSYSCSYESPDDLYKNPPIYDLYLSGSDQIWNPSMRFGLEPYFLTFAPQGSIKMSYATSVGLSNLNETEKKAFKLWLEDYSSISVREISAQQLLSSFINKEIEQVQDPSFLLTRDEWLKISIPPKIQKPYILLFTLEFSNNLLRYVEQLKKESGLEIVYLCWRQPVNPIADYIVEKDAGIEEFLGYIEKAFLVITNSFHGTVFSLILGSNNFFSYVGGSKRGSRIVDLLYQFHVENHLLNENLCQTYEELQNCVMNHDMIHELIKSERSRSCTYLKKALSC